MRSYIWIRFQRAFVCLFVALVSSGNAHAFLGLFYAEAKISTHSEIIAGLDEPTRRLIEGMPENVRKEVVESLRQSLPLINKSLAEFLQDVDLRLEKRINQLVCSGQALGQGAAEEIRGVIVRERPTPVRDLLDAYFKRGKRFESESALYLAISYEDFLQQAAITACRLADDAGLNRVNEIRIDAREFWRMWVDIEKQCTKPSECLPMRYKKVESLIASSDPRDVEAVDAKKLLAQVSLKPASAGGLNILSWLPSEKAAWLASETELLKLRTIERTLGAAKGLRITLAKRYLTDATVAMLSVEQALVKARSRLSDSVTADNEFARADATNAIAPRASILEQVNKAIVGEPSLKAEGEAVLSRLKASDSGAAEVAAIADKKNKDIADRLAEQKRQAEERERARDRFDRMECRGARRFGCVI